MKPKFFLNVEFISTKRIEDIKSIRIDISDNDELGSFNDIFSENLTLTFNNHGEIYIEDMIFDDDLLSELENVMKCVDNMIVGGFANDSRLEWISDISETSTIWFKEKDKWVRVTKTTTRSMFTEEEYWSDIKFNDHYDPDSDDNY